MKTVIIKKMKMKIPIRKKLPWTVRNEVQLVANILIAFCRAVIVCSRAAIQKFAIWNWLPFAFLSLLYVYKRAPSVGFCRNPPPPGHESLNYSYCPGFLRCFSPNLHRKIWQRISPCSCLLGERGFFCSAMHNWARIHMLTNREMQRGKGKNMLQKR